MKDYFVLLKFIEEGKAMLWDGLGIKYYFILSYFSMTNKVKKKKKWLININ